jgi:hypothetical protein
MPLAAACEPAVIRLPGRRPVHARDARRRARVMLAAWGLGEQASLGELVANAVCHGEAPIWMRLSAGGGELRVEVYDGGAGRPVRKNAGRGDEGGRGLEVLDGLIELHGGERGVISDPAGPGKTVCVVLSLETAPGGARWAAPQATRNSRGWAVLLAPARPRTAAGGQSRRCLGRVDGRGRARTCRRARCRRRGTAWPPAP